MHENLDPIPPLLRIRLKQIPVHRDILPARLVQLQPSLRTRIVSLAAVAPEYARQDHVQLRVREVDADALPRPFAEGEEVPIQIFTFEPAFRHEVVGRGKDGGVEVDEGR